MDDVAVNLEYKDFTGEGNPDGAAAAWIDQLFWQPIGTSDFPLFRFAIAKLAHDRFLWLQTYHHLIIDATGRQLVAARVAAIYDPPSASTAPAETPLTSYANLADLEEQYQESDSWTVDEAYWRARFADMPEPLVSRAILT